MEEKTLYGNAPVYLTFLTAQQYIEMDSPKASSVHCFPIKNNEILFTVNPRGIDIIGGHVETGETSEDTLIREAYEEASIIPIRYQLIGAIQVDNRDNPNAILSGYPLNGYQLFYIVNDYSELEFKADFECTARQYVAIEDIPKIHHKWLNVHNQILNALQQIKSSTQIKKIF